MEKRTLLQRFMDWTRLGRRRSKEDGSPGGNGRQSRTARLDKARALGKGSSDAAGDSSPCAPTQSVETAVCGEDLTAPVDVSKLSQREETVHRIREGFRDLSGILKSIDTNIQDQADTSRKLDEKMDVFPALLDETRKGNSAQVSLADRIGRNISDSELRQKEALKSLRALPVALAAMQENEIASYKVLAQIRDELAKRTSLEQDMAQSFQRLTGTLTEMGKCAREQADQIQGLEKSQKTLVKDFARTQEDAVERFQISQDLALKSFSKAQNDVVGTFRQTQVQNRKKLLTAVAVLAAVFGAALLAITGIVYSAVSDLSDSHKTLARSAMGQQNRLRDEMARIKEQNIESRSRLQALLDEKQKEVDLLMKATKMEMRKLGAENARLLARKEREIERLEEKLHDIGGE